jgi:CheY-like chemotaxis protein
MSKKILTVDDSKMVRILVTRALSPYDCQIFEAANGQEGLATAEREKPDLVLLDVTMPVMDGMTMLGQLRANPGFKSTPVIMLTAEFAQENIARADSLGISGYIAKPFKEQIVADKVNSVMRLATKAG